MEERALLETIVLLANIYNLTCDKPSQEVQMIPCVKLSCIHAFILSSNTYKQMTAVTIHMIPYRARAISGLPSMSTLKEEEER
jgi:hypothetical protein